MTDQTGSEPARLVYPFDAPPTGDPDTWPEIIGGKGAGLARMRRQGVPVPPGFTIPTFVGHRVAAEGWFEELDAAVRDAVGGLEATIARSLGRGDEPLLVSVRSGAPVSMPGMMDTVLNVGMSSEAAESLGRWGRDDRFGWDTYLRFLDGYTSIVGGAPRATIDRIWAEARGRRPTDELGTDELAEAVLRFRSALADAGHDVPTDPHEQVVTAIRAVFASWMAPRAVTYREREGLPASMGTAATVQAMVFGNLGNDSGTGVVFTRDPSTGADGLMGDFLAGGQGEDVVAGTHATQPISELANRWPAVAEQLSDLATSLERDLTDVADIEFTVEKGVLWILQARIGKRSPQAALRLAVAMASDPDFPLDRATAVARVAELLDDPPVVAGDGPEPEPETILASGLAASPGRAAGRVCVDPDDALRRAELGEAVVLVRRETSPADVHGMAVAAGLVTLLGGLVSHAAVVARSWGIPAVVGTDGLAITEDGIVADSTALGPGDTITVDGDSGQILLGSHASTGMTMDEVAILRSWQHEPPSAGSVASAGDEVAAEATPEACLRALALKGMATAEAVASFLGSEPSATTETLAGLVAGSQASAGPGDRFLLTPGGTELVDAAFAAEAATATSAIEPQLDRFHELNRRFKEVVTSWQMREIDGEQVMNDHSDAGYDETVLRALADEIHTGITAIVGAVEVAVPRLARYADRLQAALDGVNDGDLELMAHPLRDSYHTVWFELHEELIRLSGRNRADEAAAGRA